jgi:hypothetical protein
MVKLLVAHVRATRDPGHTAGRPMVPGEPEQRYDAQHPGMLVLPESLATELAELGEVGGVVFPGFNRPDSSTAGGTA